jgi:hypothetical protein
LAGAALLAADAAPALPPLKPDPMEPFYGGRLQRTMTLLETSSPLRRNNVRVICIGQSIMAQGYTPAALKKLCAEKYPYANVTINNYAVNGRTAEGLIRQLYQNLFPSYPDLVLFDVYDRGDQGAVERIVSDIRRYTTAEIMILTHHFDDKGEQGDIDRDNSANFRRYLAQKYNAELVEVRRDWKAYLEENNIPKMRLLCDVTHPNKDGGELLAALVMRHFRFNSILPGGWMNTVRTYELNHETEEGPSGELTFAGEPWKTDHSPDTQSCGSCEPTCSVIGTDPKNPLKLKFHGNRVDLVAFTSRSQLGTAKVLIDGKAPSQHPQAYCITMPVPPEGQTRFVSLDRVMPGDHPVVEDWTLKFYDRKYENNKLSYKVMLTGSVSGEVLTGNQDGKTLVAKGGQLYFETRDLEMGHLYRTFIQTNKVGEIPSESTLLFSTQFMGADTYAPQPGKKPGVISNHVLIQGISNAVHTLEVIPNGDGVVPISQIIVYRPPLD